MEEMIACHFHESKGTKSWTDWLHEIQCKYNHLLYISIIADKLNTCMHATTKTTPYQLVFGQPPHSSPFPGTTKGIVVEEAVCLIPQVQYTCVSCIYTKNL